MWYTAGILPRIHSIVLWPSLWISATMMIRSITWYTNRLDTYNQSSLLVVSANYLGFRVAKRNNWWIIDLQKFGSRSAPVNAICNMHLVYPRSTWCLQLSIIDRYIHLTYGWEGFTQKEADGKCVGFPVSFFFFFNSPLISFCLCAVSYQCRRSIGLGYQGYDKAWWNHLGTQTTVK